jgi:hypothetical protein
MEAFCLASGPSLTREDVELVRAWRGEDRFVYVVNNTYQLAPWADLLFVGDGNWLEHYGPSCTFAGKRVTASQRGRIDSWQVVPQGFQWFQNSGAGAIAWAIHQGAKRVHLLGYDCQKSGGKAHWHEPHEGVLKHGRKLRDAPNIKDWFTSFGGVATVAKSKGVEVLNCTRATALKCFPRATLESVVEPAAVAA